MDVVVVEEEEVVVVVVMCGGGARYGRGDVFKSTHLPCPLRQQYQMHNTSLASAYTPL